MSLPKHPGISFKELVIDGLPRMNTSIAAKALGISRVHLGRIIKGKAGITAPLAAKIGLATNTSMDMWLTSQTEYDLWVARDSANDVVEGSLTE